MAISIAKFNKQKLASPEPELVISPAYQWMQQ
jgi:hypothetical protein